MRGMGSGANPLIVSEYWADGVPCASVGTETIAKRRTSTRPKILAFKTVFMDCLLLFPGAGARPRPTRIQPRPLALREGTLLRKPQAKAECGLAGHGRGCEARFLVRCMGNLVCSGGKLPGTSPSAAPSEVDAVEEQR